jgi:polysaccharide biosynthesis transport protein
MEDYEGEDASQQGVADALRDPRGVLQRRWRSMALVFAASLVACLVWILLQPPLYRAHASVLVESQKVSEDFVRPTSQEDAVERINALTGEVLSRQKLQEIIEQRNLYPWLTKDHRLTEALVMLRSSLTVEIDRGLAGGTGRADRARILSIDFVDESPQTAADVANDIAHAFNLAGIRLGTQQARLTTEFMRREVENNEAALREQSKKVSEYQQQHRGALPAEMESNLRRLERLQQQRNSLAMQIAEAETRAATIVAQSSALDSSPSGRLQELRAQLAKELSFNTESHPNVIQLRRQIALLEQDLAKHPEAGSATGGRAVADAVRGEVGQYRDQLAQTDREIVELDAIVARAPPLTEELQALQERETVLRETYQESLRKVKEAELAENLALAQQGNRVSVLDSAFPPTKPERTRRNTAAAGFVGSLALGCLAGLFLEWLNPVLLSRGSLEAAGAVPVLGCVPRIT